MTGALGQRAWELLESEVLVLDSTELTADWLLRGRTWQLAGLIPGLSLAVPACVVAEVIANHGRACDEVQAGLVKALQVRHRLGFTPSLLEDCRPDYDYELERALEELEVRELPWPESSHQVVVSRAVSRTPPFDTKGGGYRDTLVWLSVMDVVEQGHAVHLASRDRGFAGPDGMLKRELVREADTLGGSVTLVRDLKQWVVERVGVKDVGPTDDYNREVRHEEFFTYVSGAGWNFEDAWLKPAEAGLPPECGEVSLMAILESDDWEAVVDRGLLGGGSYVEYELPARLELEATVPVEYAIERGWATDEVDADGKVDVNFALDAHIEAGVLYARRDGGMEIQFFRYERRPPSQYSWNVRDDDSPG